MSKYTNLIVIKKCSQWANPSGNGHLSDAQIIVYPYTRHHDVLQLVVNEKSVYILVKWWFPLLVDRVLFNGGGANGYFRWNLWTEPKENQTEVWGWKIKVDLDKTPNAFTTLYKNLKDRYYKNMLKLKLALFHLIYIQSDKHNRFPRKCATCDSVLGCAVSCQLHCCKTPVDHLKVFCSSFIFTVEYILNALSICQLRVGWYVYISGLFLELDLYSSVFITFRL